MLSSVLICLVLAYLVFIAGLIASAARHGSKLKVAALLIMFMWLPFFDAIAGRLILQRACAGQGTPTINRIVSGVSGIRAPRFVSADSPYYYGYKFVEARYDDSGRYELERAVAGRSTVEKGVDPKAEYMLHEAETQRTLYFATTHISVRELSTNEELSGFERIVFRGGLLERMLMLFSDAGFRPVASCKNYTSGEDSSLALLHATLPPDGSNRDLDQ